MGHVRGLPPQAHVGESTVRPRARLGVEERFDVHEVRLWSYSCCLPRRPWTCATTAVERALAICDRLRCPSDQFKTRALLVRCLHEARVDSKVAHKGLHLLQQLQYVLKFLVQALNICEMRREVRLRGAQRFAHLRRRRATAVSGRMAGSRAGRDPEGSGSPERGEQGQLGSHLPRSRLGHLFFSFCFSFVPSAEGTVRRRQTWFKSTLRGS